jgi:hypothetical protein
MNRRKFFGLLAGGAVGAASGQPRVIEYDENTTAEPPKVDFSRFTSHNQAALLALLAAYGIPNPTRMTPDESRHASRILLELGEGIHPGSYSDFAEVVNTIARSGHH